MTTVSSGQTQFVSSGQTVSGTIVLNGGTEYVSSGGTADATLLSGVIDNFGIVSGATIFLPRARVARGHRTRNCCRCCSPSLRSARHDSPHPTCRRSLEKQVEDILGAKNSY
jgi:autotransporter passenger strand-loop-strand repeat protein